MSIGSGKSKVVPVPVVGISIAERSFLQLKSERDGTTDGFRLPNKRHSDPSVSHYCRENWWEMCTSLQQYMHHPGTILPTHAE